MKRQESCQAKAHLHNVIHVSGRTSAFMDGYKSCFQNIKAVCVNSSIVKLETYCRSWRPIVKSPTYCQLTACVHSSERIAKAFVLNAQRRCIFLPNTRHICRSILCALVSSSLIIVSYLPSKIDSNPNHLPHNGSKRRFLPHVLPSGQF